MAEVSTPKITNQEYARLFLSKFSRESGRPLLYICQPDIFAFYDHERGYYKLFTGRNSFETKLLEFIDAVSLSKKNISPSLLKDIKELIKILCVNTTDSLATHFLALKDALLNTKTFETEPFSPEQITYFPLNSLNKTDALASDDPNCPRFLKFLDEVIVDEHLKPDKNLQNAIQERFGYCLLPSNICEKSFFFVGDGANGKSVLLSILRKLVGEEFCTSKSIEALTTDRFSASGLVGKRLNICMEEESKYMKSDKFKALISGEPIDMERKYEDSFTAPISVKFVFATNRMPTFDGIGHGLMRRLDIIPFNRTFALADQDRSLFKTLLAELPEITRWALAGARRLVAADYKFSPCRAIDRRHQELKEEISSAARFMAETYVELKGASTSCQQIYNEYVLWCSEVNKKKMSYFSFFNDLKDVLTIPASRRWDPETKKNARFRDVVRRGDEDFSPVTP